MKQANGYWTTFDLNELKVRPNGWFDQALSSSSNKLPSAAGTTFNSVIPNLSKRYRDILSTPIEELKSKDVQALFIAYELCIENRVNKKEIKLNSAIACSSASRTALSKPDIELTDGLLIQHVHFKTKLYVQITPGRKLVSDLYDEGCLIEGKPMFAQEISKIEFTTEKEYLEKAIQHLEYRLYRIKAAAWDTISQYHNLKNEIKEVMSIPVPPKL